ncbi:hypothetical protein [Lentibacter algarum]|uniref:phage head spike fiber domain-containing protein n=1 Tax=Lentibacter algarum TaxID=576131 RepID=UPI0026E981D1|nr:hypothetical protein [Lentibacter algarum]
MADELNIPTHRWYQRQNNVQFAKQDMSKQWIYASGISRLLSSTAIYAANGFNPAMVLDFAGETYFVDSETTTFDSAITHAATTNATMVDSDGLLKWRPHNLLPYSEDFSQWQNNNVTVTGGKLAPDGTNTATELAAASATNSSILQQPSLPDAVYTFDIWVRSDTETTFEVDMQMTVGGHLRTELAISTEWQKFSITETSGLTRVYLGGFSTFQTGMVVEVWGAHAYRSDLGGMVNNPDRGDSYVPTTTAARYLPRRGHHVYNGTSWVNEGLLHESDARTNLVTYSQAFTNAWWTKVGVTAAAASETGPDGQASMSVMTLSSVNQQHDLYGPAITASSVVLTASVVVRAGTLRYVGLRLFGDTNKWSTAVFDLTTASVTQESVGSTSGTIVAANIESLGGGLYRLSLTASDNDPQDVLVVQFHNTGTPTLNTFGGDTWLGAGETIEIGLAQLEVGLTPSSYIPTAGATATRAAETLTVPAANMPWPTPVVIGEELVTNGTFDSDVSGWSATNATLSVLSQALAITRTAASYHADQTITVDVGNVYRVTATRLSSSPYTGSTTLRIGSSLDGSQYGDIIFESATEDTALSLTFTANTTTTYLQLGRGMGTDGDVAYYDNISVKEINPLSVSIQMDGLMTYADTNSGNQVRWMQWGTGADPTISAYLRTTSARTGDPIWSQVDAVTTFIDGSDTAYAPGINVPYNIAARHGSTFVNGAVDGTALTANLTPTALPDLSATDFSLAPTYNGTIGKLRVWSDDIGDTGIAEASA